MKIHTELDEELTALLTEFVAGNLPADEARAVERHLEHCATCRDAVAWMVPTLETLMATPIAVEPPDGAWDRIAARVTSETDEAVQPWKTWSPGEAASASLIRNASEDGWRNTGVEGIEVRELAVEPDGSAVTMLIRMQPGASFPAHEHGGPEECFVLSGDLQVGDLPMHAGDFQRMEAGSTHPDQTTRDGCLLFLRSSTEDRLL